METAAVSAVPPYFGQSDLADAREISRLRQSHAVGVVADPSRRASPNPDRPIQTS